ncbi:MAG: polysaccharide biosynthesis tyrosine autokinase [Thermoleophilaceae bacterium]
MELRDVVALAWKRRWLVLLVTLLTVGIGTALAASRPEKYESTATVAVTPDFSKGNFVPPDTVAALVQTYAQTAKSALTKQRASQLAGRPLPGIVKTGTQQDAGILTITGRAGTQPDATLTARKVTQAFIQSVSANKLVTARVVDPASTPKKAVEPRPPLIVAAALLLGLAGGVLLAFALEHFRRRIETAADVAEFTPAPVIGRLPKQRALSQNGVAPIWQVGVELPKLAHLQEAFRALRTNLEFLTETGGSVIQVTSPVPGQGKSTVVANLGIALAQIGVETVIVDADLRRPMQNQIFGVDNRRGLSTQLVVGGTAIEPSPTEYPQLRVLPSGPVPHNSTEILHIRFRGVIEELRRTGATVIVDSSPLLPISDARVIAPVMDGVLLVLDAGSQKPAELRSAIEKLELSGARLLGIVLNRTGDEDDAGAGYEYYRVVQASEETREESPAAR